VQAEDAERRHASLRPLGPVPLRAMSGVAWERPFVPPGYVFAEPPRLTTPVWRDPGSMKGSVRTRAAGRQTVRSDLPSVWCLL
jgi:hypothetical protein